MLAGNTSSELYDKLQEIVLHAEKNASYLPDKVDPPLQMPLVFQHHHHNIPTFH